VPKTRSRSKRSNRSGRSIAVAVGLVLCVVAVVSPQSDVTDADLARVGGGRVFAIGTLTPDRTVTRVPIETYVARVLAGEAEPNAPDGELQALAIAIRTYATFNAGRHSRDGFDLCDTTHCQVMRTATAATRRAALATAGEILTWQGAPAEIFYSASCGGRSESAAAIWSGSHLPYLQSVVDDVHEGDAPWSYTLRLETLQRLLVQRGFAGQRLRDVRIASHTASGRVATLELPGLEPNVIAGDQFRLLVGARDVKSTAFTIQRHGNELALTGRGYGHGVGMCVIGAGRRARRGETVERILAQYYPGLEITSLDAAVTRVKSETVVAVAEPEGSRPAPAAESTAASVRSPVTPSAMTIRGVAAQPSGFQQAAARAHQTVTQLLGIPASPLTIDVHDTVEGFRQATGKPWWVSASVNGQTVDLAPLSLLVQRDGVDITLRNAIAQALMASDLAGRPEWVRVGGARYLSRLPASAAVDLTAKVKCPADAELTLAISAAAQREAESRAEACFARAYSVTRDWRTIR
jgi:SpoIID/LytB domain protein